MTSLYDVMVKIKVYPKEAREANTLRDATNIIIDFIDKTFNNPPITLSIGGGEMGGYFGYATFSFAINGTNIANASGKAFGLLLAKVRHHPNYYRIEPHIFSKDNNIREIPEEEIIELEPVEK